MFRHFVTIFRTSTKFRSSRRIELFFYFFAFYFISTSSLRITYLLCHNREMEICLKYCHFLAKNQRILRNKKFKLYYCPKLQVYRMARRVYTMKKVFLVLILVNSYANPIVYALQSTLFRRHMVSNYFMLMENRSKNAQIFAWLFKSKTQIYLTQTLSDLCHVGTK